MISRKDFIKTCAAGAITLITGCKQFTDCKEHSWYNISYSPNKQPRCKYKTIFVKGNANAICTTTQVDIYGTKSYDFSIPVADSIKCPTYRRFEIHLDDFEKTMLRLDKEADCQHYRYIITNDNNDVGFLGTIRKCYNFRPNPYKITVYKPENKL